MKKPQTIDYVILAVLAALLLPLLFGMPTPESILETVSLAG